MSTLFVDNAYGTLGSGLLTTDSALNFTAGHGARFPAVTAPDVLYCCILNSSNILEEVIITAHTSGADSCTITRAAGGTTAKAWNTGDRIEARLSTTSFKAAVKFFAFDAGTRMAFNQTAAPTGWTKDTTAAANDSAMRIVTGTAGTFGSAGGSAAFSTALATPALSGTTDGHQLTIAEMPSHTHPSSANNTPGNQIVAAGGTGVATFGTVTGSTGGDGTHLHNLSSNGQAVINVKYNDFIVASKDSY